MYIDVDTAVHLPVNIMPLIDDDDFKSIEDSIDYDEGGMDLNWNFVTTAGVTTQTNVVPTTSGVYDWAHEGNGMYSIEIPASGGGSINNDTEGFGWFSGVCDDVLPWRGPVYYFRAAALNNALIDGGDNLDVNVAEISDDSAAADNLESACDNYSATRGLTGTALPAAVADAAGGVPISDAGGLDLDDALNTAIYTNGFIYFDDSGSGGGTTLGVDGTPLNPQDSEANAKTLGLALGTRKIFVKGSMILDSLDFEYFHFLGSDPSALLQAGGAGNAVLNNTNVERMRLTGDFDMTVNTSIIDCEILTGITGIQGWFKNCRFGASTTPEAGRTIIEDCMGSEMEGANRPSFDCTASTVQLEFKNWRGELEITDMTDAADKVVVNLNGGKLVVNANNTDGDIFVTGTGEVSGAGGGVNLDTSGLGIHFIEGVDATDQIQTAANAAMVALNLDHLMKTAVANNADMTAEVTDGTVLSNIMSKTSDTSTYTVADDALEAIADMAAPSAGTIADAVWDEATSGHVSAGTFGLQCKTQIDAIKAVADTFNFSGSAVDCNLKQIADSATVDGLAVATMFKNFIAILQGDVDRTAGSNIYNYLLQDGSTTAVTLTISSTGRTAS